MRSISETLSSSFTGLRSAPSWFVYAAFSTMMMLLRTVVNDLIPHQTRTFIVTKLKAFFSDRHNINQVSLQIDNYWDGQSNQLFKAAKEYLPTKITQTYKSLKVGKLSKDKNLVVGVDGKQDVTDEFEGIKLKWKLVTGGSPKEDGHGRYGRSKEEEESAFTLTFDEKHREKVMNDYIPHVLSAYKAMKAEQSNEQSDLNQVSLEIEKCWEGQSNQLFIAAKKYLPTKITQTYKSLKAGTLATDMAKDNFAVALDGKQDVVDEYHGIKFKWKLVTKAISLKEDGRPKEEEESAFTLTFDEKHRKKVMNDYIPHVLRTYRMGHCYI